MKLFKIQKNFKILTDLKFAILILLLIVVMNNMNPINGLHVKNYYTIYNNNYYK